MEGSERDGGDRSGSSVSAAPDEPVAQADRLFADLAGQAARLPSRKRLERKVAADDEPGGPPEAGSRIESEPGLSDVGEVLEMVRAALWATNERLGSLERIIFTGEPPASEPVVQALEQLGRTLRRSVITSFQLDGDLNSEQDVAVSSGWLPVLGLIPHVHDWKGRMISLVGEATKEERVAAEAYRALRTNVLFLGVDAQMRTIQVTSPLQGEGKTTVTAMLGVSLAQAGSRVIVLSCDLRRPHLHEFFGLPNEKGFTSVLYRLDPLQTVIQEVADVPNLRLVAAGSKPPNPSELLLTPRAGKIILALQEQCDVLLIDAPPALPVTDAIAISALVDATVVVANAVTTSRRDLHRTVEAFRQVNASLLGTVVNGISRDRSGFGLDAVGRYDYDADPR